MILAETGGGPPEGPQSAKPRHGPPLRVSRFSSPTRFWFEVFRFSVGSFLRWKIEKTVLCARRCKRFLG